MASSTPINSALALVLVGTVAGFFIGRITNTANYSPSIPSPQPSESDDTIAPASQPPMPETPKITPVHAEPEPYSDSDDGELAEFPGNQEECKLVLVVRTDLGMTKGKMAAQASHATLACYKALQRSSAKSSHKLRHTSVLQQWEYFGQAKIAVQARSEEELLTLQAQALSLGLCAKIIHDAGRTQIASGSATCLGIGPGPRSVVDQVTGRLKLL